MIKKILLFFGGISILFFACHTSHNSQPEILTIQAPERFKALFNTTKGDFEIEVYRDWGPKGADRLYQLITSGFYENMIIFRMQKEYVVQFGISDDSTLNKFWMKHAIKDEPLTHSNLKGTIAYARDGADTRDSQLFINMNDNQKLDTISYLGARGFPPIGKVTKGFEVVQSFYSEYKREPAEYQDSIYQYGNAYLEDNYPELDRIISAKIIDNK